MGKYFGWVGVGGVEWGWVHCLTMPKFHGLLLSKKYIPSAKTLYTEDSTLLSTAYVKIHRITYVIFETVSHFSGYNSSVFF